jgi:hypothetical protein
MEEVMAFILDILRKGSEDFKLDPTQIHAEVKLAHSPNGEIYLNIRTYGSAAREHPNDMSQKLQLGPDAIAQLKRILAEV